MVITGVYRGYGGAMVLLTALIQVMKSLVLRDAVQQVSRGLCMVYSWICLYLLTCDALLR